VGIGGAAGELMAESMSANLTPTQSSAARNVVQRARAFRHSGSTRTIRHRCLGYRAPGGVWCGYAYEMLVEAALRSRLPVSLYASELRARPAASGDVGTTTVEWLATIVVVDESIVAAVSDEYETQLEKLKELLEKQA
jgi:hypothetical protein